MRLIKMHMTKKKKKRKPYYKSEREFMGIMKRNGVKLIPYPKKFCVFLCGRPNTYTPDFQEVGTNRYYEVTNSKRCYQVNKRKYDSFRELNPSLLLINVKPNGEPYVYTEPNSNKIYEYKEKSYFNKERDEIVEL